MDSEVVNDNNEKSENLKSIPNENKIDETDKDQKESHIANIEADTLKHSESILEPKAELKEVDESSDTKNSEKKFTDNKTNEDEVSGIYISFFSASIYEIITCDFSNLFK